MLTEKLMDQGVSLAVNGDRLTVETAAPLTDEQRDYIRSHKPQLMTELRAVAANDEASVVTRLEKIAKELHHPLSDLLDWYRNDMEDLAQKSDADLRFIVSNYVNNPVLYGRSIPEKEPEVITTPTVFCGDCQRFKPIDHPFLGHCDAGVKEPMAGMWKTSSRSCDQYVEAGQQAGAPLNTG